MKKTMMIKMPTVEGDIGADGQEVNDNNMITIVTPVEVAPTLVRAFESERVGRERTNQLVLQSGGGDDHDNDDGRGNCKQ